MSTITKAWLIIGIIFLIGPLCFEGFTGIHPLSIRVWISGIMTWLLITVIAAIIKGES